MSTGQPRRPSVPLSNGLEMPLLGLGVWQVPDGEQTENAVSWALEAGYRHVDTAQVYGNESAVGRAIHSSGLRREEVFVTTKLNPQTKDAGRAIQESLGRLRLDHVDLFLIHWPSAGAVEQWGALELAYDQGLARTIGVSNWGSRELDALVRRGRIKPLVDQVQFSPFQFRRALLEHSRRLQITLEAYSPLTRGRSLENPTIARVARDLDRTPAQVMLRWAIERDIPVIPKSTHRARIVENAQIFDFQLAPDAIDALDALDQTGGTGSAR
ncbi:MAG TPA: aldo/keto reductase [Acidimicrobiia bacterium]|nr:aldo/keto reductase [Acidimicrobiia bacterium]